MALEVFPTYTEFSDDGDHLTVNTNDVVVSGMPRNIDEYLHKSFGAGKFGAFSHLGSFKITTAVNGSTGGVYALTNTVDDLAALANKEVIYLYLNSIAGPTHRLQFQQRNLSGVVDFDSYSGLTSGQQYWYELSRSGTTVQCLLYDDEPMTSLIATMILSGEAQTYEHSMPVASYNSGSGTAISYEVSDFDYQEAVAAVPSNMMMMGMG